MLAGRTHLVDLIESGAYAAAQAICAYFANGSAACGGMAETCAYGTHGRTRGPGQRRAPPPGTSMEEFASDKIPAQSLGKLGQSF
jgi:hypothetical protein